METDCQTRIKRLLRSRRGFFCLLIGAAIVFASYNAWAAGQTSGPAAQEPGIETDSGQGLEVVLTDSDRQTAQFVPVGYGADGFIPSFYEENPYQETASNPDGNQKCSFSLSVESAGFNAVGGSGSVRIMTAANCAWHVVGEIRGWTLGTT